MNSKRLNRWREIVAFSLVSLFISSIVNAETNSSTYIDMPDDVRLAADIWLPDSANESNAVPAIVEFTRYWRATEMQPATDNINEPRRQALDHGYAYVAVDVRGTGASFGSRGAEFSLAEARDMPHVIDWIAAQPWSNGKVVTMGISYDGNTSELAGLFPSSALVAAVPRFTDYDWYTSIVIPGGLKNAYITERWGAGVQALDRNDVSIFGEHTGEVSASNPKVIGVKPVDVDVERQLLAEAVAGHYENKSVADHLAGLIYRDEYPSARTLQDDGGLGVSIHNFRSEYEESALPMYHWGSWFDAGTAAGVLARFREFDAPYRHVIGPWSHGARFDTNPYKDKDAPVEPSLDEQFDQIFSFADSQMGENPAPPAKELIYYTVGENEWKSTNVWPPKGHHFERWWLAADGALSSTGPEADEGADDYAVNFDVGSGASSRWATQLGGGDVYYGDRSEADQQLLTYTSPPLESAVEITGTAVVTLQLSSTHEDGAVIVYLESVDEDGYVRMLSEGELRLRHRATNGPDDPVFGPSRSYESKDSQPMVPGDVAEVRIGLLPVSARVEAGASLRIAIAGHDKDTFIRVPAEGEPVLTIERNAVHASFIDLPVIERPEPPRAADVEAWADELFADSLARKRMSGAVLTMVQGGEIVLSKGYGFADYAAGTAVSPADTRFRIGSTTKTFTSLAIAQLIEQGRIDSLDDPANLYLKRLQLPSPNGADITIKHLITHSAGFENRVYNIASEQDYELPLSADVIAGYEPTIVSEPGEFSSYNNYGTTVLGLIVEDITDQPIADYFDEHIFAPLGMTKSILNMSPEPSDGLSVPYGFLPNGEALAIPHRTVHPFFAPVGGINATGDDMARYMLAQLDAGQSDDAILSPEMFQQLHGQIRANHTLSSGFGMIYFTLDWNGTDMVVHGGDWPGTHSAMMLFPEIDTGVFFSLLAEYPEVPILEGIVGSERMTSSPDVTVDTPITNFGVLYSFVERFLGVYRRPDLPPVESPDLSDYVGSYVGQSAPVSTMERLLNLGNSFNVMNVTADESGTGLLFNGKGPFRPIGADVFWDEAYTSPMDGFFLDTAIFSFSRDDTGEIAYLVPQIGFDAWVKTGALQNPQTWTTILGLSFLVCLTGVIAVFYPRIETRRLAKWLPGLVVVGLVALPLIVLLGQSDGDTIIDDLFFGRSGRFVLLGTVANLLALVALLQAWHGVVAWRESFWSESRLGAIMRLHYSIIAIAAIALVAALGYWQLLGV